MPSFSRAMSRMSRSIAGCPARGDFGTVCLPARALHPPIGADSGEAVRADLDDFARFAADPLGVLGRQRFCLEHLEVLSIDRGPGAWGGIAAADEAIDLDPRLAPVDARIVRSATTFIGGFGLVLLDAGSLPGFDEIDGFQHRIDTHWKEPVEIDAAQSVGRGDLRFLLQQHLSGIETVVGPEDGKPVLV